MSLICPNRDCGNKELARIIKHGKDRHGRLRYKCSECGKTFFELVKPPRKQAKKGLKGERGRPELYDEVKGKMTLSLTQTAIKGLDDLAVQHDLSRSELVERIGRGLIPIAKPKHHQQ